MKTYEQCIKEWTTPVNEASNKKFDFIKFIKYMTEHEQNIKSSYKIDQLFARGYGSAIGALRYTFNHLTPKGQEQPIPALTNNCIYLMNVAADGTVQSLKKEDIRGGMEIAGGTYAYCRALEYLREFE